MRLPLLVPLLAVPLALAGPADACPVCDRETGRQVRAGLFDRDFGRNLLAAVLPFGVVFGVTAAIRFGLPPGGRPGAVPARPGGGSP